MKNTFMRWQAIICLAKAVDSLICKETASHGGKMDDKALAS